MRKCYLFWLYSAYIHASSLAGSPRPSNSSIASIKERDFWPISNSNIFLVLNLIEGPVSSPWCLSFLNQAKQYADIHVPAESPGPLGFQWGGVEYGLMFMIRDGDHPLTWFNVSTIIRGLIEYDSLQERCHSLEFTAIEMGNLDDVGLGSFHSLEGSPVATPSSSLNTRPNLEGMFDARRAEHKHLLNGEYSMGNRLISRNV